MERGGSEGEGARHEGETKIVYIARLFVPSRPPNPRPPLLPLSLSPTITPLFFCHLFPLHLRNRESYTCTRAVRGDHAGRSTTPHGVSELSFFRVSLSGIISARASRHPFSRTVEMSTKALAALSRGREVA